jgi:peptidyl-prolyl cis-trans isomerase C
MTANAAAFVLIAFLGVNSSGAEDTEFPAPREAPVVAVVNGERILAQDIARQLRSVHTAVAEGERSSFDLDGLMFKMVNDTLIGQEARALEMHEEPDIRRKVDAYRQRLARERLERVEVRERTQPTEEEVRQLFEQQYRRATFRVLTAYEQGGAEQLLAELRSGAEIETLAKERSVDPYRLRGGLVENLARIDLQREVAELVFSLQPGEEGGPVRTDLGWSVVRLESFSAADPAKLPDLERTLQGLVRQSKAAARREELAQELRSRHGLELRQEVVDQIEPERLADSRLIPKITDPEAVVATIGNGQRITAADYGQALLARWKGVRNEQAARAAAPIILGKLIEDKVLDAEALERGYGGLADIQQAVHAYETQLLIPRYLEEIVAADIAVTEEEKRAYYEEHRNEFHRPPRVRLGQITVGSEAEALRIAELLRKGGDLQWLAEKHSLDGYKEKGGDRGWMVPQPGAEGFQQELFEAEVGTVLEPFAALDNFIVLKVTGREEQGIYDLGEISGNIREAVFTMKFRLALDRFITVLRERSEIEIDEEALADLSITATMNKAPGGDDTSGKHFD